MHGNHSPREKNKGNLLDETKNVKKNKIKKEKQNFVQCAKIKDGIKKRVVKNTDLIYGRFSHWTKNVYGISVTLCVYCM